MSDHTETNDIVSIWYLVGLVLALYGFIVTGCGIYYSVYGLPTNTLSGESNPSLWWGLLILISGIIFIIFGKNKKESV